MTATVTSEQIRAIHTLKSKARMDEGDYRALLAGYGVASSKELSRDRAISLIDRLQVISGGARGQPEAGSKARGALKLGGPYAGICRALWISGWNLGVFDAREDTALVAFVKRQTRIEHLNWVRDPVDGSKVVDALKAWIAREAGVTWPTKTADAQARKLAVIAAQLTRLGRPQQLGVIIARVGSDATFDLDRTIVQLGAQVRALPKKAMS